MPHPRMHVSLTAFNVIVKVVAEKLNVRDGVKCRVILSKVSREKHKSDITYIFRVPEPRKIAYFERRITVTVQHLWSVLDARWGVLNARTAGINEFLRCSLRGCHD